MEQIERRGSIGRGVDKVGVVIAISSSSKFYHQAEAVACSLDRAGFLVYTPNFAFNETKRSVSEDEKRGLTHSFLEALRRCSHLYVVAANGYVGRSVCIEIGYAYALGKPIILSECAEELAVRALTSEVIPRQKACDYFSNQHHRYDDRVPIAK